MVVLTLACDGALERIAVTGVARFAGSMSSSVCERETVDAGLRQVDFLDTRSRRSIS